MRQYLKIPIKIFLVFNLLSCTNKSEFNGVRGWKGLTGIWERINSDEVNKYIVVDSNGYFSVKNDSNLHAPEKEKFVKLSYEVDTTTKPFKIDLIVLQASDNSELERSLGILEFESNDEIRLYINDSPDFDRPRDFKEVKGFYYQRIKK